MYNQLFYYKANEIKKNKNITNLRIAHEKTFICLPEKKTKKLILVITNILTKLKHALGLIQNYLHYWK